MNTRTSDENYQAVGTHDRRHIYCYVQVRTETPVRTLPDIISGEVRETVVIDSEYVRFNTVSDRQAFIDNFDTCTYEPKQRTKRSFSDIEKITGKTVATQVRIVKRSQVNTNKVNEDRSQKATHNPLVYPA